MDCVSCANTLRAYSAEELKEWIYSQSDTEEWRISSMSAGQIYDLWAMLKELQKSSAIPKPLRGMLMFKLSVLFGIRSAGTRHNREDMYDLCKLMKDREIGRLPRLYIELLSWTQGRCVGPDIQSVNYSFSGNFFTAIDKFLKELQAFLDKGFLYNKGNSTLPHTLQQEMSLSILSPILLPLSQDDDSSEPALSNTSTGNTPLNARHSLGTFTRPVALQQWIEGLLCLHSRISDERFGLPKETGDKTTSRRELLKRTLSAVNDLVVRLGYKIPLMDNSQQLRLTLPNKIKDEHFWTLPEVSTNVSKKGAQVSCGDYSTWVCSTINDYSDRELVGCFSTRKRERSPNNYKREIQRKKATSSLHTYLLSVKDDFDNMEPELWRTRSLVGYFEAYRALLYSAEANLQTLSQVMGVKTRMNEPHTERKKHEMYLADVIRLCGIDRS